MIASKRYEVIIIGGGLSGLTLGYFLQKAGISFLLLEARNRLGGRIETIATKEGATLELGATWFADKHQSLMQLIHELEIPYELQYTGFRMLYDFANPNRTIQLHELPGSSEPSYLFSEGSRSLIDALTRQLDCKVLHLGEQVHTINCTKDACQVVTNQSSYHSQVVVSTLPPALFMQQVAVYPSLPEDLVDLCKKTHTWMGESIKVGLEFSHPFWRDHEVGTFFSQYGPIQELHDHIHSEQQVPILKGFLHAHFRGWEHQQLQEAITQQLKGYFNQEIPELKAFYLKDWQEDTATYHAYKGYVGPHQYNGHPILRKPYLDHGFYFGGSESAVSFPGYMDGAVERSIHLSEYLNSLI